MSQRNLLLVSATKLEHQQDDLFGIPIHIIGIGKVEAAVNTLKLIQEFKPDHVINFGSCGSLGNWEQSQLFEVGEVHDDFYGCVVPNHEIIKTSDSKIKLFTTDLFYDKGKQYSDYYTSKIQECDLVDMEGYSVAKVCKSEGIFVSLFKWVSDDGDSQKWEANAANGFNKFKKLFYERFRN